MSILILSSDEVKSIKGPKFTPAVVFAPPIVLTCSPFKLLPDPIILLSVGTPKEAINAFIPLSVPLVLSKYGRL